MTDNQNFKTPADLKIGDHIHIGAASGNAVVVAVNTLSDGRTRISAKPDNSTPNVVGVFAPDTETRIEVID